MSKNWFKGINTKYTVGSHFVSIWPHSVDNVLYTISKVLGVDDNGNTQCIVDMFYNPKSSIHYWTDDERKGEPILEDILSTIEGMDHVHTKRAITEEQFQAMAKEFGIDINRKKTGAA